MRGRRCQRCSSSPTAPGSTTTPIAGASLRRLTFDRALVLHEVSAYGRGSSFSRSTKLLGPEVVSLTTRWHTYRDDAFFNALITHPRLRPCFEAALAGEIAGESDHTLADDAALAHLRAKNRPRSGHLWVDRMVDRLSERQDLFHAIECSNARGKKAHLVRAYMAALI